MEFVLSSAFPDGIQSSQAFIRQWKDKISEAQEAQQKEGKDNQRKQPSKKKKSTETTESTQLAAKKRRISPPTQTEYEPTDSQVHGVDDTAQEFSIPCLEEHPVMTSDTQQQGN